MRNYGNHSSTIFAASLALFLFTANASAQDGTQGVMAQFDAADSASRLVVFDSTSARPVDMIRAKVEAEAKAAGRTVSLIPFGKSEFERGLRRIVDDTATLKGIEIHGSSLQFTDAENIDVLLDITLARSSQAELLINTANDILSKIPTGQKIQFGAKPVSKKLLPPVVGVVLDAINKDLSSPNLRLAGCQITKVRFEDNGDGSRSTLVEGTLAFTFQSDSVINTVQATLNRLGFEDWAEVRPDDAGFKIQPPDMSLYFAKLKLALRDNDATVLNVIMCDATLEPDKDAPDQTVVILNGYISVAEAEAVVVDVANQVATVFFEPYLAREEDAQSVNVKPTLLELRPTSPSASRQFVRLAHSHLQEGRFQEAINNLVLAAFEDRQAMDTMYWLAVANLKMGDEKEARRILKLTVRRNARLMEEARRGRINGYADLMHTLESVQGSLRQRLHELEGQVYAEYCKTTRRKT